ncbi:MAG: cyclic nucleotide-binding domain-containing protein, partial [Firmicutes bacterium]|nr:cyclic nucleotide-binding domain-containing protein [Bacillota bacterium]
MDLANYFPVCDMITEDERKKLCSVAVERVVPQGTLLHSGESDCVGLLVICAGQLRAFITSDEGREITLYRWLERDICLFSASCMMNSIQFDIMISAEKETRFWIIPPEYYKNLMEKSVEVANYTNRIMVDRFSEVMWLMEQIMWKRFYKRLASFLLEEIVLEDTDK